MPPAFATVVFDLDGTPIDGAPEIAGTLNTVLAAHGRPALPVDGVIGMIGDGSAMLLRRGFEARGGPAPVFDAALARFVEVYDAWQADPAQIHPGVPEILGALRADGVRIGRVHQRARDGHAVGPRRPRPARGPGGPRRPLGAHRMRAAVLTVSPPSTAPPAPP